MAGERIQYRWNAGFQIQIYKLGSNSPNTYRIFQGLEWRDRVKVDKKLREEYPDADIRYVEGDFKPE